MILLDTTIDVHYRFLNLHSAESGRAEDVSAGRRGQANGLCGAAVPGELSMVTGTHTGPVHVVVELHDDEPPLGDEWEEAVEVPFSSAADDLVLSAFQDTTEPLNLPPGNYRVRYCARGMQEGREADSTDEPVDHYLLQFWPARDRIVRRTGDFAAYWHDDPDEEPAPTLAERVAAVQQSREQPAGDEDDDSWLYETTIVQGDDGTWYDQSAVDDGTWFQEAVGPGDMDDQDYSVGRSPVDRLAARDPALVIALIGVDEPARRAVARWAAGDALTAAGVADEPWVRQMLEDDPGGSTRSISITVEDDDPRAAAALRSALEAAGHAARPDTLTAACGALWRDDPETDVLQRVRREFPGL